MSNTIQIYSLWLRYAEELPSTTTPEEKENSKRAFYAGCSYLLEYLEFLDMMAEQDQKASITSIYAELEVTREQLAYGRNH